MKIEIITKDFLKELKKLESITKIKSQFSILSFVHLEIGEEKSTLTATNMKIWQYLNITNTIWGKNKSDNLSILLPQKAFQTIVKQVKTTTFILDYDENVINYTIKIIAGKYEYTLPYDASDEFPLSPAFADVVTTLKMETNIFLDAVSKIAYVSKQKCDMGAYEGLQRSYVMTSEGGTLSLAAINVHTFAISEIYTKMIAEFKHVVPIFAIDQLKKSVIEEGNLTITTHKLYMSFISEDVTIIARFHDLVPPPLDRLLASKPEAVWCGIHSAEICQILKDIKFIYAGLEAKQVLFSKTGNELNISCENPVAKLRMSTKMKIERGDDIARSFTIHGDFIQDIFKTAGKRFIKWSLTDDGVCYFEFDNSLHMIMSMEPINDEE